MMVPYILQSVRKEERNAARKATEEKRQERERARRTAEVSVDVVLYTLETWLDSTLLQLF